MAWGKAGSTTLEADDYKIDTTVSDSKFGMFLTHSLQDGTVDAKIQFGTDGTPSSSSYYSFHQRFNWGTEGVVASSTNIDVGVGGYSADSFHVGFFSNISGEQKLIWESMANLGTAITFAEQVGGKYNDGGTNLPLNVYRFNEGGTATDIATGSNSIVLGSDITPTTGKPTNVQVGSRWEETDTRKIYAYGSDIITDGNYTVLKYTADGTFTPTSSFDVEYLVVGGGGGGGDSFSKQAGGGGAGGYRTNFGGTALGVTAQSYSITVGAGGAGSTSTTATGTSGSDSVFSSITSDGGGGGGKGGDGAQSAQTGLSGGSGGGGGGSGYTNNGGSGGTATSGQGYAGGAGNKTSSTGGSNQASGRAGGGGGASQVGRNGASDATGNFGGAGLSNSITGTAYTYSAGGEGGDSHNQNAHDDGLYYGDGGSGDSGNGANGVVIIRFLTSGNTYTSSIGNSWKEIGA